MTTWKDKANRLIASQCLASYRQANVKPDGSRRKRHVPYAVPELARQLVECLKAGNEHRAKSLFLSYDGLKAT